MNGHRHRRASDPRGGGPGEVPGRLAGGRRVPGGRAMFGAMLLPLVLALPLVHAESPLPPEEVIRSTTAQVMQRLEEHPELAGDVDRLQAMVNDLVLPRFDFERMARRVLGKYWRRASEEQRGRFISEFQTLLVKTYALAMDSFETPDIAYGPHRSRSDTEVSIRTEVSGAGRSGMPITYELHLTEGGWKVYDVVVDGVSLSLTYRSDFRSLVRQEGIEALIARMMEHNRRTP